MWKVKKKSNPELNLLFGTMCIFQTWPKFGRGDEGRRKGEGGGEQGGRGRGRGGKGEEGVGEQREVVRQGQGGQGMSTRWREVMVKGRAGCGSQARGVDGGWGGWVGASVAFGVTSEFCFIVGAISPMWGFTSKRMWLFFDFFDTFECMCWCVLNLNIRGLFGVESQHSSPFWGRISTFESFSGSNLNIQNKGFGYSECALLIPKLTHSVFGACVNRGAKRVKKKSQQKADMYMSVLW